MYKINKQFLWGHTSWEPPILGDYVDVIQLVFMSEVYLGKSLVF